MKRLFTLIAACVLATLCVAGCTQNATPAPSASSAQSDDRLHVVATIFPTYDWTLQVLGEQAENVDVTLLVDNGTDLHSYQPTVADIAMIGDCDVFIYVGGESDQWVDDALAQAPNKDMVVVNLMDALGNSVKHEEIVEGMEEKADDEAHDHEASDGHAHTESEAELDEHVWLSLKNARVLVGAIADALGEADPDHADDYTAHSRAYQEELAQLDADYAAAVADGVRTVVLFADRFPFRYLADDYNLAYYAAFSGCSAESEASFETVRFLASKIDELGLPAILTIETSNGKIASTVRDSTQSKDQEILVLDSMQSKSSSDIASGATYLGIMRNNATVLARALG